VRTAAFWAWRVPWRRAGSARIEWRWYTRCTMRPARGFRCRQPAEILANAGATTHDDGWRIYDGLPCTLGGASFAHKRIADSSSE
jgi:hypothetical protein